LLAQWSTQISVSIGFRGQLYGAYRDMQRNPSPFSETSTTNHSEVEEIVSVLLFQKSQDKAVAAI
jgi:hypothetical protein